MHGLHRLLRHILPAVWHLPMTVCMSMTSEESATATAVTHVRTWLVVTVTIRRRGLLDVVVFFAPHCWL